MTAVVVIGYENPETPGWAKQTKYRTEKYKLDMDKLSLLRTCLEANGAEQIDVSDVKQSGGKGKKSGPQLSTWLKKVDKQKNINHRDTEKK